MYYQLNAEIITLRMKKSEELREALNRKEQLAREVNENDFKLSRSQKKELKRRMKEMDSSVRYVVATSILPKKHFYYLIESNCYGMDLDQASLIRSESLAIAIAKSLNEGREEEIRNNDRLGHFPIKITIKNNRRKVLRYLP